MVNLSDQPLPTLTRGQYSFIVGAEVWALRAPGETDERVGKIALNKIYIASGDLPSGWVEVEMPTGGIGYVPKQSIVSQ